MKWFVLYVKPQQEKKVARTLETLNIEAYAPHITEFRQWSDRKKKVEAPLFKSYVFVKLNERSRNLVFDAPGVVRYLFWLGKPAVVREEEIETIKEWLTDDAVDEVFISQFAKGDEVRIKKGPLKNKQAVIKEVGRSKMQLVLKDMGVVLNAKINELL